MKQLMNPPEAAPQPPRRFRRIHPDERKFLECERPLNLRQETVYLILGRIPPIPLARCLWIAIRQRMA